MVVTPVRLVAFQRPKEFFESLPSQIFLSFQTELLLIIFWTRDEEIIMDTSYYDFDGDKAAKVNDISTDKKLDAFTKMIAPFHSKGVMICNCEKRSMWSPYSQEPYIYPSAFHVEFRLP